jgi:hypothetical protein
LAHEPFGWRPMTLLVTLQRYRCTGCGHLWRQVTSKAAEPRAKLSRRGLRWALEGIVVQHLTVARVAEGLGVSWGTANDAVLAEGRRILIDDPNRFDGVQVVGVDEHVWRHTRKGDKYAVCGRRVNNTPLAILAARSDVGSPAYTAGKSMNRPWCFGNGRIGIRRSPSTYSNRVGVLVDRRAGATGESRSGFEPMVTGRV